MVCSFILLMRLQRLAAHRHLLRLVEYDMCGDKVVVAVVVSIAVLILPRGRADSAVYLNSHADGEILKHRLAEALEIYEGIVIAVWFLNGDSYVCCLSVGIDVEP